MDQQAMQSLVQQLRGPAAQIVLAFFFSGFRAMDAKDIKAWTGLKLETIHNNIPTLESLSMIGEQTTAHGRKLWVPGSAMLFTEVTRSLTDGSAELQESVGRIPEAQESGKRIPGAPIIIVTQGSPKVSSISNNNNNQESGKRIPGAQEPAERIPDPATVKALQRHGIVGRKRNELLACEWVTATYVDAHVDYAKAEGRWKGGGHIGIAIIRMLDHMPEPKRQDNGHTENCACDECTGAEDQPTWRYQSPEVIHAPESTGFCIWQDKLPDVHESGPLQGQHKLTPFCKGPRRAGSRYCEKHHQRARLELESE